MAESYLPVHNTVTNSDNDRYIGYATEIEQFFSRSNNFISGDYNSVFPMCNYE